MAEPEDDRRFFSLDEVNALVPELEERFKRILRSVQQAREVTSYLSGLGGAHPGSLRGDLRRLYAEIQDEIAWVQDRGCVVKDVSSGLVDFWHEREGEQVLLCWKLGEEAVRYFHTQAEGFAGRRPLDPDDEEDVSELADFVTDDEDEEDDDLELSIPGLTLPSEEDEDDHDLLLGPDDDEDDDPDDDDDEDDEDDDPGSSGALH